ncbi:MAG: hypothetical protein A2V64_05810 [Bacteroidetes bacterium RBG_13_43_22]|nr:MAG: hypothetical protein A2V64_05810 [Bacteroidetes bacterium RBG_13_43_22]
MASLIPEYNYDIFISYRQKDNKGDRWVSEFVNALKVELEATFKEDISIFFDENPHDRLQETYNVDKSLEGKLKCLIFIPILSQTYCDPQCYAWQCEFLPFIRMAEEDRFGKDVKLRNGNVTSRILPVRIHDLDPEDIKLFEKETKSVIRTLDFVFKTATGVNRPVRANEDHPNDNLNKTFYRDQINKVANAVKEIIMGLQTEPAVSEKEKTRHGDKYQEAGIEDKKPEPERSFNLTRRRMYSGMTFIALLIVVILFYPRIFKRDKFENIRDPEGKISIAVMPFENHTGDTTLNWFQRGISSLIINGLGSSGELAVRDDQTMFEAMESMDQVFTASISPSVARKVAEKSRAETYITGSYQGRKGLFRILVNLVDTESGKVIWTNKVEGDLESPEYLSLADSLCNEIKDYLEIKALEQKTDFDFRDAYTKSPEAYRYFIEGVDLVLTSEYESAINSLKKAYEIDSTFTFASFYIALAYDFSNLSDRNEPVNLWTQKAYNAKERLPIKYQNWLGLWYACLISLNPEEMIRYCNLLEKSGIESRILWFDLGVTYVDFFHQYDKAIDAFEKVEKISQERGNDWKYDRYYNGYCEALLMTERPKEVTKIAEIGLMINPDNGWLKVLKGSSYAMLGDTIATGEMISEIKLILEKYNQSKSVEESVLGNMYSLAKDSIKTVEHYRKAYNLDPENLSRLQDLVWSLIRFEINIEEGLELCQKVLDEHPDLTWCLWMKGLALHKLGNHSEGLVLMKEADEKYNAYFKYLKDDIQEAEKAIASQKNN